MKLHSACTSHNSQVPHLSWTLKRVWGTHKSYWIDIERASDILNGCQVNQIFFFTSFPSILSFNILLLAMNRKTIVTKITFSFMAVYYRWHGIQSCILVVWQIIIIQNGCLWLAIRKVLLVSLNSNIVALKHLCKTLVWRNNILHAGIWSTVPVFWAIFHQILSYSYPSWFPSLSLKMFPSQ